MYVANMPQQCTRCSRHSNVMSAQQAGGEAELAMEMWWRAAALDALQARRPVAPPLMLLLLSPTFVCTTLQCNKTLPGTAEV